ncbi:putative membrane protein YphA (DoxX/SURF4 family) [Salirhabdus euzebyi]|uniref:Putative membrane protein YphA (DoxX/SURF4 family) n=1 Tax=Salirhabdus euzebyi TaxID=394506 RepID=A0A841Q326_9BACI|nr:DoxX family membrane protein [Salirhabdus euzebyi]MBB6452338.1 putative membrane protein YphA (DoxX/SURF4 family) [Salirhabdus euzebyi]
MKKKQIIPAIFLILIITPVTALGHVKWFATQTPVKEPIENILTPFFLLFALFIAILLGLLTQVLPKLMKIAWIQKTEKKLASYRHLSRYILKYGTAIALILQVLSSSVFAPEFKVTTMWEIYWIWITIAILVIPHHIATKIASLSLLVLFIKVLGNVGLFHILDYGYYLAIIGVLLIGKTKLEEWGFPLLYLGTGLSLCWVAVEKWVYPHLTVEIIHHHHVPTFGFEPEVFIVMAAFIEFIVGYLLVVGILNRVLSVVVTILFVLTTTIFGYTEVVGHFMIHIVLLIFIIEGVSFYHPPVAMHTNILNKVIFVSLNFIFTLSTFLLIYYRFA